MSWQINNVTHTQRTLCPLPLCFFSLSFYPHTPISSLHVHVHGQCSVSPTYTWTSSLTPTDTCTYTCTCRRSPSEALHTLTLVQLGKQGYTTQSMCFRKADLRLKLTLILKPRLRWSCNTKGYIVCFCKPKTSALLPILF